jgi:outer membrane protein assembly factor BamE (lipoprotein component of BamABCDE complex)
MSRLAVIVACVLISACSLQRAEEAQVAQSRLVGMSAERVLACMGPPLNKATLGQTEVWSYGSGNNRTAVSYGNGVAVGTQRFCTVNVVMTGGRVSAVNYSGPTGGLLSRDEQCAFAIENCLR